MRTHPVDKLLKQHCYKSAVGLLQLVCFYVYKSITNSGHSPGASEMLMAKAVSHLGSKTPGKESIAIESFANALRQVNMYNL